MRGGRTFAILVIAGCYGPNLDKADPDGAGAPDARASAADARADGPAGDGAPLEDAPVVDGPNAPDAGPCTIGNDGAPCEGGLCRGGVCDPSSCYIAGTWVADLEIDPANPCHQCRTATSRVAWSPLPAGTFCTSGGDGRCDGAGLCCTGCFDASNGNACVDGSRDDACGHAGVTCADCAPGACFCDDVACPGQFDAWLPVACISGVCTAYGAPECCGIDDGVCAIGTSCLPTGCP